MTTDLTTLLLVAASCLVTGAVSKTSDLFNDDGLVSVRGASEVSGVVWGATGALAVLLHPGVAAVWLSTVLYWFLRGKLDHFNHAFAGVCIGAAGVVAADRGKVDVAAFLALLAWLAVSGYVNTALKEQYAPTRPLLAAFLRLRLRYYAGPVVLSLATGDVLPAVAILAGMAGTEAVTVGWARRAARARQPEPVLPVPVLEPSR